MLSFKTTWAGGLKDIGLDMVVGIVNLVHQTSILVSQLISRVVAFEKPHGLNLHVEDGMQSSEIIVGPQSVNLI